MAKSQSYIKTGGNFDPEDKHIYFLASGIGRQKLGGTIHNYLLIAVNELTTDEDVNQVKRWIENGHKLFIDSGVFNLTMEHSRKYNVSMDTALAIPPDKLYGFDKLFDRYVEILLEIGDSCWGYIEIDAGGRENKIKTRTKLEALGLRPIPVYHPLNDGWDYFDYLAQRYDRICLGNIVQANRETRIKLLATLWERRKEYPHLWVHVLGLTTSELMIAYPTDSCDSSSWLTAVRWGIGYRTTALCKTISGIDTNYRYELASDPQGATGADRAVLMSAISYKMLQQSWQSYIKTLEGIGVDAYAE